MLYEEGDFIDTRWGAALIVQVFETRYIVFSLKLQRLLLLSDSGIYSKKSKYGYPYYLDEVMEAQEPRYQAFLNAENKRIDRVNVGIERSNQKAQKNGNGQMKEKKKNINKPQKELLRKTLRL